MVDFDFFYADIEASITMLNRYVVDAWVHANNGVVASRLRGGLLSGCNIRFSFITNIGIGYREEDMDYKNQGLFIFEEYLYFRVLDKFQIDGKAQILLSPENNIEQFGLDDIIRSARGDFRMLHKAEPIAILNNDEWKRRVAIVPGVNGKNSPLKGFLTNY